MVYIEHLKILQVDRKINKKSKKKYRVSSDPAELQPGRWVWRTNPRETKRLLLDTPWLGPFLIVGRAGNALELQMLGQPNEVVNIGMVKLAVNAGH